MKPRILSAPLVRFDTSGTLLGTMDHPDLPLPQGIAFDDRGRMFATSFSAHQIVEFDAEGNYVRTITDGGLQTPRCIAFDPQETATSIVAPVDVVASFLSASRVPKRVHVPDIDRVPASAARRSCEARGIRCSGTSGARTLVNGWRSGGEHVADWDGSDGQGRRVAKGVYVYRLTSGTSRQSRKMLRL